jgi:hypothetical protein
MYFAVAFAIFSLICTVFAFTRHPIWGLYFYLATTYVFPPGRWWGGIFGDLRWALLSAAVTTLAIFFHRGKLKPKPLWIGHAAVMLLVMYSVWMWIQTLWALDVPEHARGSTEFLKCLFALWFVYRVVDSKERVRDLMLAHVLGCALLGVFALTVGREGDRLDGVGGPNMDDSNTLGMYLVTAVVTAVGLVLTQKGWRRYVSLASLPLILNAVVLANSRGSFLGFVAGMLVLAVCTARQHRWMLWAFALVGAAGLAMIVDQVFIDRMFTIQDVASKDEDADPSARSRLVIAEAQLAMFLDYPMGTGWRGTVVLSPRYMDQRWLTGEVDSASRSSHATYMTALSEQGLPGAVIYLCLVLWVIAAAVRIRRWNGQQHDPELITMGAALCGAIMVVLAAGLTADYLTKEVQFWLYAGLVSVFWLVRSEAQGTGVGSGTIHPVRLAGSMR